jgi:hypothetical protein
MIRQGIRSGSSGSRPQFFKQTGQYFTKVP